MSCFSRVVKRRFADRKDLHSDEDLPRTRLRGVDFDHLGRQLPGLVIDDGSVLLWDRISFHECEAAWDILLVNSLSQDLLGRTSVCLVRIFRPSLIYNK